MPEPISIHDAKHQRSLYEPLTQSVRHLIDVAIRSEADGEAVRQAHRLIDEAVELLSTRLHQGSYGLRHVVDGTPLVWGNVAMGLRNAIAPPLEVHKRPDGRVCADLFLGAPYEGPAGHVHGGMCALVLDHVLSATAHRDQSPAVTGTLIIRYVRPTTLGQLRAEAWTDRDEGSKTFAVGQITDSDGNVTVRAEGVFIRPNTSGDRGSHGVERRD
ncbi:PaaI family thioesterase [Mycolicibacterium wolinskyi]|uniref:Acyl-coenzyme A thioesterase THEM4 n=1 Tax=Mycolicibacterium wolinskyi TaxID=59750 RepID=A0A1X2FAK3_9MYCO|nr:MULTISPECIES: PaaI family thioesterase [Mycolicibacterium]MCV7285528.1 PaaI family thioesterase [Mycolicibacterium wolinskyi]MCV7291441.1 PaaI family thioesterase [Mycolicibacterium goodii]ORX15481.1 thioesterase [Mycolicibacterium wolinskyi]